MNCRSCSGKLNVPLNPSLNKIEAHDVAISRSSKKNVQFVQCPNCNLVQLSARETHEEITNLYRQLADNEYDTQRKWRKRSFVYDLQRLSKSLQNHPRKFLEVGSFTGIGAEAILQVFPSAEYIGIEPSNWAAQLARNKGFQVISQAIEEELPEKNFEIVASWAVIEHLENPNVFFEQINKVTVNNAFLFLNFPDWDSPWRKLLGRRWWFIEPKHRTYFNQNTLCHLAARHGWALVEGWSQKKCRSLTYLIERVLDRFGLNVDLSPWPDLAINYFPGQRAVILKKVNFQ